MSGFFHLVCFSGHPCCSIYQYIITFVCVYSTLFIHSSVDGQMGCLHILAIMNSIALSIHVHVFVWIDVFNSLGSIGVELGHMVTMFNFLRNYQTVLHSS